MSIRQWSTRHSALMESIYAVVKKCFIVLHPIWKKVGYQRIEKPTAFVEKQVKGLLFDCQMCGQCILSNTGMACPMNCPKNLRNGPCGGVRLDGNCEVQPNMRCVWVEAWEGSQHMKHGNTIFDVQYPLDSRLKGSSAWLRMTREATATHPKGKL